MTVVIAAADEKKARGLTPKIRLGLGVGTAAVVVALLHFFRHVLVVVQPRQWPPLDFHDKGVHGRIEVWEWLLCLVAVPLLCWKSRFALARGIHALVWQWQHRRRRFLVILLIFSVVVLTIWMAILRPLLYPPPCEGWLWTDVGYIQGHERWGHNLQALCRGQVWEPHVAQAIDRHLYGQGRAMDVGAFVGYHTMRLAKAAAPHQVYAVEGRMQDELSHNLRRNNAQHQVQVISTTVQRGWELPSFIVEDPTPLSLIKIDCEGCELHFLRAAHDLLRKWKPVLIIEIQDDATRRTARLGGQQMIVPEGSRQEVLSLLRDDFGYTVMPLLDLRDGSETWDYLAIVE